MGLFSSTFSKIKQGLTKTREVLNTDVRVLLRGRVLTPQLLDELETKLLQSDLGAAPTQELITKLRTAYRENQIKSGDDAFGYLRRHLEDVFPHDETKIQFAQAGTPTVILVAGINGSGKTTSIAKIAKAMRDMNKKVILAACDTFRAAAVEQLEVWARRLGVEVVKGKQGGDPAAVAFDAAQAATARGYDVLIVDTAGRLHTQKHLMDQLEKIQRVIRKHIEGAPHEVLLVIDATTGQNGIRQAEVFKQAIDVTGIFLTKLDGTAKGGIAVAIRRQLGIPVKFIGVGETPEDVEPFDPKKFTEAIFAE